jgi:hypothetical protein
LYGTLAEFFQDLHHLDHVLGVVAAVVHEANAQPVGFAFILSAIFHANELTDDDSNLSNRMIQDVLQRQQAGASFKLYVDRVLSGGSVSPTLSRSVEFEAVLTSASLTVNPDDAQSVEISFRPAGTPTFDFCKSFFSLFLIKST